MLDRGGGRGPDLAAGAKQGAAQPDTERPGGHPGHTDPPAAQRQVLTAPGGDHGLFRRRLGGAQLCLPGQLGPAAWPCSAAKMMFFRSPGPDFSERDRDLLALLQPHLHQAYLDAERRRHGTPRLTPRQRELMRLVAAGHTNTKIARQLGIAEGTVRSHLEDIYSRLQVSSRAAAVARVFPDGTAV